jgi:integrase
MLTKSMIDKVAPAKGTVKVSDGGGLQLWIKPNGTKLWCMAYRFDGKQRKLSFGEYPAVGIIEARARRDAAKHAIGEGIDPAETRRAEKKARKAQAAVTFDVVANEYLAKLTRDGRMDNTVDKNRWLLDFARKEIGARPISEIKAAEVLPVLKKLEDRGRRESARRLRSTIGSVFRYAVATARAENDPTVALRGALSPPKTEHRAAVYDLKKLGGLLRAIDGFDGQPTTRAGLQLLALLAPRPGELRMAEWSEFDLDGAVWSVPAGRMKMRRPHAVPLPTQAIAIFKDFRKFTGTGRLAFPSVRSTARSISDGTFNAALRRLGYKKDEVTAHGFRATFSTLANESGKWHPDAIERQLAHVDSDDVRRAYARGAYWDERVKMMQWWADYLDQLRWPDGGVFG